MIYSDIFFGHFEHTKAFIPLKTYSNGFSPLHTELLKRIYNILAIYL